jgi:hypothetical protein
MSPNNHTYQILYVIPLIHLNKYVMPLIYNLNKYVMPLMNHINKYVMPL